MSGELEVGDGGDEELLNERQERSQDPTAVKCKFRKTLLHRFPVAVMHSRSLYKRACSQHAVVKSLMRSGHDFLKGNLPITWSTLDRRCRTDILNWQSETVWDHEGGWNHRQTTDQWVPWVWGGGGGVGEWGRKRQTTWWKGSLDCICSLCGMC